MIASARRVTTAVIVAALLALGVGVGIVVVGYLTGPSAACTRVTDDAVRALKAAIADLEIGSKPDFSLQGTLPEACGDHTGEAWSTIIVRFGNESQASTMMGTFGRRTMLAMMCKPRAEMTTRGYALTDAARKRLRRHLSA